MRHNVDGRQFGRNTSHRRAMFRNMANLVITHEQIITTVQKAKEVRRVVDRLITLGKTGGPAHQRLAFDRTRDNYVVRKIFGELVARYANRAGGYTRVLKMANRRRGDAAEMAVLELVDHPPIARLRPIPATPADASTPTPGVDVVKRAQRAYKPKRVLAGGEAHTQAQKERPVKAKGNTATSHNAGNR